MGVEELQELWYFDNARGGDNGDPDGFGDGNFEAGGGGEGVNVEDEMVVAFYGDEVAEGSGDEGGEGVSYWLEVGAEYGEDLVELGGHFCLGYTYT